VLAPAPVLVAFLLLVVADVVLLPVISVNGSGEWLLCVLCVHVTCVYALCAYIYDCVFVYG